MKIFLQKIENEVTMLYEVRKKELYFKFQNK